MMGKIKIGVTGLGSLIGQAIVKSIINSELTSKIHIIGFDYFTHTIGSFWVDNSIVLPDCLKKEIAEEYWLEKIIDYIGQEDIKVLFIGLDFELKLFAKYKNIIESRTQCKVMVSDYNVIEIADDKYLTYKFLKDNKLYYPETYLPDEINNTNIHFPCIVKPRSGWRSKDVYTVENINVLHEMLPKIKNPIIQELIGSHEDEYTCGIIYFNNSLKKMIALQRDLKDGNTITACFRKNIPQIIYEYIQQVSDYLKPFGACNYQLRMDNNMKPKIFEINARHSGTTYIRSLFGFYEVEYILAYVMGYRIKDFDIKEGVVKRYYNEMFIGK
ncbi:MAG: ATP-grasp domain-containing protein [Elusimicrobia bacterium]|nr:ATP-grasp domain-containing protein [Elusimicrobiota bacterium]